MRAFDSEDTFQGGCAGWYMISFQIPCFSPAVRILRNTCSYIRLKAIPPSGHPCRLPRFVHTTKSSLSGISFEHKIHVAVCMSPTRSPKCALAPVRRIKFHLSDCLTNYLIANLIADVQRLERGLQLQHIICTVRDEEIHGECCRKPRLGRGTTDPSTSLVLC